MNALGFAATQGIGGPIQREVVQSYSLENAESVPKLLKKPFTHLELIGAYLELVKPNFGIAHREVQHVSEVFASDSHRQCFFAQSRASAVWADRLAAVPGLKHAVLNFVAALFDHFKEGVNPCKILATLP